MRSRFLICLVVLVPCLSGCLVRTGVAVTHESGKSHVAFDGQMGIHPLGLVRSVARHGDAGFGVTARGDGPAGLYVEGALVTNRSPLAAASGDIDALELRQVVAIDATLMMHGERGPLRPGIDALLVTETAAFAHVNTPRDFSWGEMGAGLYLSGRFDRKSWAASLGVQVRSCACVPHD
jgi:hypothetical protein